MFGGAGWSELNSGAWLPGDGELGIVVEPCGEVLELPGVADEP
jgi:hypothetical protein